MGATAVGTLTVKANVAGATPLMSDLRRHAVTMLRPLASAMSIHPRDFHHARRGSALNGTIEKPDLVLPLEACPHCDPSVLLDPAARAAAPSARSWVGSLCCR